MMRSLVVKLTAAFLLVGITGAVLVALLVGQRTRSEFDRFVDNQNQYYIVDFLENYYQENGSWEGVDSSPYGLRYFNEDGPRSNLPLLVNIDGYPINGRSANPIPLSELHKGQPIEVDGNVVGWLLQRQNSNAPGPADRATARSDAPDISAQFLRNVSWATATSAIIAVLIALLLGGILARTLTQPIRELQTATHTMARGELGYQVTVRSNDELGQLASSFNQMSRDLAHTEQQRQQMTADIAHDLRTPLTILRGYTEGLQDGRLQGSDRLYNIMHAEVTHLQHLVEDLRTLSLADAGQLSLNLRAVDPRALLERTGLSYIMPAEEKGLTLRIEADDKLPSVLVDADRMAQVLGNLVSNALKHTAQGDIVLGADTNEGNVRIWVQDSGSGIDAEDLPNIFKRFYRADKSRHRSDNGDSGLGLAIAKAIVTAHEGKITAVSQPNQGTTITITLPSHSA